MNYLMALVVAGLLILGMFLFRWVVRHAFRQELQQRGGDLSREQNYGMEVPSGVLIWLSLADFIYVFRIPLSLLILVCALGCAWYCGTG
ncbi:MAG: hypothetical protein ACIAZJ_28120 [Gimesia chilikensis]|uniref:hypothetical protein n=1 Tax=Gimesia chilikensis TaxID=2605989 RepID=UPI00378A62FE